MNADAELIVDPWCVRQVGLDLNGLGQSESIFALSNGHIGVRGNLDEGDPSYLPGTYLNSFYEKRPLPYAEGGYGFPESGQTVVNVADGKLIRLLVDDQPLDTRYGRVIHHERNLDLRAGLLRREMEWEAPSGVRVILRSTRMVSFTQRALLAIHLEVEAVNRPVNVVMQSELVANEDIPIKTDDPRVAAALDKPLELIEKSNTGDRSMLMFETKQSKLRFAAACDHIIDTDVDGDGVADDVHSHTFLGDDWTRTTAGAQLAPGESLRVDKFVTYGWSHRRSPAALRDQVDAALSSAMHTGWDGLLAEQRAFLDEFWDGADVEIDGAPAIQQAVRFALWHVLQAGARAEGRAIPAKGLTGPGYDGHSFWDTETYVLPVLAATRPLASAHALVWRLRTLEDALDRAKTLHLKGAAFPWRTIWGQECSGYWPAGTAAFHINADIAVMAARHVWWTGDQDFDRETALPLLVHTARLWESLGHFGDDGHFHIDGVTGPDEYSAIVDDNIYTNLMAARNMLFAAETVERWPREAADLAVTAEEIGVWREAYEKISLPFDDERGVHQQDRGFTGHALWDFAETDRNKRYPLLLNYPYFDIYRKQVVKQADLVMAMHWCGDRFTPLEKAKAFEYYERVTVRDSSLSACAQSVMAAETGHLDLAWKYLNEAALMDLRDLEHNTKDGVHMASLAGSWLALVCGFGGMRDHHGHLTFDPHLPADVSRLAFAIHWRECKVRVEITADRATYTLDDGPDGHVTLSHAGQEFLLTTHQPVSHPIVAIEPLTPTPTQPVGLEPGLNRFNEN
ncbi:glycoside hydrolase family 65 protein [Calidifontibacter terrae]